MPVNTEAAALQARQAKAAKAGRLEHAGIGNTPSVLRTIRTTRNMTLHLWPGCSVRGTVPRNQVYVAASILASLKK